MLSDNNSINGTGKPTLRPYQVIGKDFMAVHSGAGLGDDPGLGKTVEILSTVKDLDLKHPIIIISRPLNKRYWERMIEVWDPGVPYLSTEKAGRFDHEVVIGWIKAKKRGYLITHHEGLRYSIELLQAFGIWGAVIADEAHRFNNRKALMTKALHSIKSTYRWALTGTPIDKNPADYWANLNWMAPERFGSYWQWEARHCKKTFSFSGKAIITARDPESLAADLAQYWIIRHKVEIAEQLPPITNTPVEVELEAPQLALYKRLERETFIELEGHKWADLDDQVFIKSALARMSMLRQAALDPMLLNQPGLGSAKLQWLLEWSQDIAEPFVVFTCSRGFAKTVHDYLPGGGLVIGIGEGITQKSREKVLVDFMQGQLKYIVGTIQSIGESINLQAASIAVFTDPHFSTIKMSQAEARIHRLDSPRPVQLIKLFAPKTVDIPIYENLTRVGGERALVERFMKLAKEQ